MSLPIPLQERSVDPYSDNRYSSVINRLTRMITNGRNTILFQDESFIMTRDSDTQVTVYPGICIKDDLLIHINSNYLLDLSDDLYYEDLTPGGMSSAGYYYLVLRYNSQRSYPSPAAYLKVIRDKTIFITYPTNYLFLGTAKVISDGMGGFILESNPDCIRYTDPDDPSVVRQTANQFTIDSIDGGII